MEFESHYATVNGLNMHYVTAGEGPPVILLHGFPDTHQIWRRQIPELAATGLRVIAPDLRDTARPICRRTSARMPCRFWPMMYCD
jgi:pimeloyl-ACP methyl ester carboxylesterase